VAGFPSLRNETRAINLSRSRSRCRALSLRRPRKFCGSLKT
jgi:hypothetical protein